MSGILMRSCSADSAVKGGSPSAEMADVVLRFQQLSKNEREQCLIQLIHPLSPYEWRSLKARMNARTFQKDIVGSLPLELVIQVFGYLDFTVIYKFQRVSSGWKSILKRSSLQASLSPSEWMRDVVKTSCSESETTDRLTHCARTYRAFRDGAPSKSFRFSSDALGYRPWGDIWKDDLCGETFAYVTAHSKSVLCHDFGKLVTKEFAGAGREDIDCLGLSRSMLGVKTLTGFCYAFDLATSERRLLKLPSAQTLGFSVYERDLIIPISSDGNKLTIILWSFETQKTRTLGIDNVLGPEEYIDQTFPVSVFPNPSMSSAKVFFSLRTDEGKAVKFRYLTCSLLGAGMIENNSDIEYRLCWRKRFGFGPSRQHCGNNKVEVAYLVTQAPEILDVLVLDLDKDVHHTLGQKNCGEQGLSLWNEVTYVGVMDDEPSIWPSEAEVEQAAADQPLLVRTIDGKPSEEFAKVNRLDLKRHGAFAIVHGNESLVVTRSPTELCVYSFNPNVDFKDAAALLGVEERSRTKSSP